MSSGGRIVKISNYGPQDRHITNNPQITFFKNVYKRHTNFSIEQLLIPMDEGAGSRERFGQEIRAIIPRNGNLLHKLYLYLDISMYNETGDTLFTVTNFLNTIIKNATIKIGSTIIEQYRSEFKQAKSELFNTDENRYNFSDPTYGGKPIVTDLNDPYVSDTMTRSFGNQPLFVKGLTTSTTQIKKKLVYEFDFWFTRDIGHSLPLDALYNHQIELIFNYETKNNMLGNENIEMSIADAKLMGEYIYLDRDEQQRFSSASHEYLIEQTQYQGSETTDEPINDALFKTLVQKNYTLNFIQPVKYLLWCITSPGTAGENSGLGPTYFTSQTTNSTIDNDGNDGTLSLLLDNQYVIPENTPIIFYTRIQPKRLTGNMAALDTVGMYSFALKPFDIEPSGTCNFSRIQRSKVLSTQFANNDPTKIGEKSLMIFAVNYNILRISGGMGGTLYT